MIVVPPAVETRLNDDARAAVVVVVTAITRVAIGAITVVRAGRPKADAYATGTRIKTHLRHGWRGGENCCGCENADCDLFHGVLLSLLTTRKRPTIGAVPNYIALPQSPQTIKFDGT